MRLQNALKYQIKSSGKAVGIYYGMILAIRFAFLFMAIYIIKDDQYHMSGLEANTAVFMSVVSMCWLTDDFRFFIQNGYSRKSMIKVNVVTMVLTALALSTLDIVMAQFTNQIIPYESMMSQLYGDQSWILQWVLLFIFYMAIGMVSYVLTLLFKRMSKQRRILVFLMIPTILILMIPTLDSFVFDHAISTFLIKNLMKIMGLYQGIHIVTPMISFTIITMVAIAFSYILIRRVEVNALK